MDRTLGGDRRRAWLLMTGATAFVAIAAFAYKMYVIDAGGISFMDSGTEAPTTSTTGTSTESCTVIPMVPNAPEDTPMLSDAVLHPNAQAVIKSNQEAIGHLKFALRAAHSCAEQQAMREHIQMLRNEIASMRSGVVPIRPPYNYD